MSDNKPTFLRRDDLSVVDMDGEAVMMCLKSGAYFGLNDVGLFIWQALATPQSEDSLRELLLAAYDIDEASARHDVAAFLDLLKTKGLITS